MAGTRERITETMSGADALLWTIGRDPVLRPTVIAVLALDRAPGWADVRARIAVLTEIVPRFGSHAASRPLGRGTPSSWRTATSTSTSTSGASYCRLKRRSGTCSTSPR